MCSDKRAFLDHLLNDHLNSDSTTLWKNLKRVFVPDRHDFDLPSDLFDLHAVNDHFLNVLGRDEVTRSDLTYYEYNRHGPDKFCTQCNH